MSNRVRTGSVKFWMVASVAGILAACSSLGEGGGSAATAWPTLADVTGDSSAFSDAGIAALDARMKEAVDKGEVAGLEHILIKDGHVIDYDIWGSQSYGGAPMTENTLFRIRSMTKPITAVAMMQLWEKGLWKPEDPITKFLPELTNLKVATSRDNLDNLVDITRPPTMNELMTHTAGFGYGLSPASAVDRAFIENHPMAQPDLNALVKRVGEIPLLIQPGERWSYSIAVDLQGAIVERLSGMSFGDYLEKNVFKPLGMDHTSFELQESDRANFATVYQLNAGTGKFDVYPDSYTFFNKDTAESGGGGLASTTHDYARYAQMMLNEGELDGSRVLKPDTVKLMMTNHIGDTPGVFTGGGFGYGGAVQTREPSARSPYPVGTYSWFGIDGSWFWIDPSNKLAYVGMIQRRGNAGRDAVNLRGESPALVYEALKK